MTLTSLRQSLVFNNVMVSILLLTKIVLYGQLLCFAFALSTLFYSRLSISQTQLVKFTSIFLYTSLTIAIFISQTSHIESKLHISLIILHFQKIVNLLTFLLTSVHVFYRGYSILTSSTLIGTSLLIAPFVSTTTFSNINPIVTRSNLFHRKF